MSFALLTGTTSTQHFSLLCREVHVELGSCAEPILFCHNLQCQKLPCKEVTANTEGGTVAVLHISHCGLQVFYECELRGTDSTTAASLWSPEALSAPDWPAAQQGMAGGHLWASHWVSLAQAQLGSCQTL